MKKIKVFVASSVKELQNDRVEIGNFFRKLNEFYLDDGLYFQLIMCEDLDDTLSLEGKQEEYNREITDSDLSFFLFFKKTGKHTLEEFDIALDSFRKTTKPKITTYFKAVDPEARTDEVNRFIERLSKELGHYYKTYEHVDSLKLGMMMQIKLLGLDEVDVKLEGGKVTDGSEELLSLDNVEMVTGYDELQKLKAELSELDSRFQEAKATYLENPDDSAAYEAYLELSNKRNDAKKRLGDMETALYSLIEHMYEQTAGGELSKKQVEAYRLMERGKFNEAKQLLDFDEIVSDSRRDEQLLDQAAEHAQMHVNELMQLIDVNRVLLDWEAMNACYKEAVHLEERFDLPKKAMFVYSNFLYLHCFRYTEAIKSAEKLLYYWQNPESGAIDWQKERLLKRLGILYYNIKCFAKAEEVLKTAIEVNKSSTKNDDVMHEIDLMFTYVILVNTYIKSGRYKQAEEVLLKATEIAEKYVGSDIDGTRKQLAYLYYDWGELYYYTGRYDEVEKPILTSFELYKRERARYPDVIDPNIDVNLIMGYNCIGAAYTKTGQYEKAEEAYSSALDIAKELDKQNPLVSKFEIAGCNKGLGELYFEAGDYIKAEEAFSTAVDIMKSILDREPAIYEPVLAEVYTGLGKAYMNNEEFYEAESTFYASLELCKKINAANPDYFVHETAANHYLLAELYKLTNRVKKAKEACNTALAMFESRDTTNIDYAQYEAKTRELKDELDNPQ